MKPLPWQAGQEIAGRYRLDELVGTGATAQVWRAHDSELRSAVALKLLDPAHAGGEIAARLLREARAAAVLRSLHVVQILDHGLHEGVPYIAMELLEGETLAQRLDRVGGPLPSAMVCKVMTGVGRAVTKAHAAGIVHRDLKPQNIFLVRDDEEEVAKVFDFGIAKVSVELSRGGATANTKIGSLLGTPDYMSPEQARGSRTVDSRTDLWSMAVITFECVTGRPAFANPDLAELLESIVHGPLPFPSAFADVPPEFDIWFAKAASREPELRFASAKEMTDALREALLER